MQRAGYLLLRSVTALRSGFFLLLKQTKQCRIVLWCIIHAYFLSVHKSVCYGATALQRPDRMMWTSPQNTEMHSIEQHERSSTKFAQPVRYIYWFVVGRASWNDLKGKTPPMNEITGNSLFHWITEILAFILERTEGVTWKIFTC